MEITEEREWEIADQVAKHLVEQNGLESPNLLQTQRDKLLLQKTVRELGFEQEIETYSLGLMGRVNAKLCEYSQAK